MAHYNRKELASALRDSGLQRGDIVFGHSNIGFFGLPEEGSDRQTVFEVVLDAFFDVIGPEGTVVVPTFTYSFPKGEIYDPNETPGIGGMFAEMVRLLPESYRSHDPCVSVAAIGGKADELTRNVPQNTYSDDGIFGRLLSHEAKTCNLNIDAATTFVHYAERKTGVPYRFDKTFSGVIRINGEEKKTKSTIFVHYLVDEVEPVFEPFDRIAMEQKLCKKSEVGRGFVKTMKITDQFRLVQETLDKDPWFLTAAGQTGRIPDPSLFTDKNK